MNLTSLTLRKSLVPKELLLINNTNILQERQKPILFRSINNFQETKDKLDVIRHTKYIRIFIESHQFKDYKQYDPCQIFDHSFHNCNLSLSLFKMVPVPLDLKSVRMRNPFPTLYSNYKNFQLANYTQSSKSNTKQHAPPTKTSTFKPDINVPNI